MDIFAYLTNGTVVPFTGVTAIASVDLHPTITLQTTATATAGSPVLTTVTSTTGIVVGMYAFGPGVPPGTRVAGFTNNSVVVLDRNVTVSGTGSNFAFHGVAAADYEICRFDSGTYRDLFTASTDGLGASWTTQWNGGDEQFVISTEGVFSAPGVVAVPTGELDTQPDNLRTTTSNPQTATVTKAVLVAPTGELSISDEINHFSPRQLSWYEAMWKVTCTVGTETIEHYLRKAVVNGFGNVTPLI